MNDVFTITQLMSYQHCYWIIIPTSHASCLNTIVMVACQDEPPGCFYGYRYMSMVVHAFGKVEQSWIIIFPASFTSLKCSLHWCWSHTYFNWPLNLPFRPTYYGYHQQPLIHVSEGNVVIWSAVDYLPWDQLAYHPLCYNKDRGTLSHTDQSVSWASFVFVSMRRSRFFFFYWTKLSDASHTLQISILWP